MNISKKENTVVKIIEVGPRDGLQNESVLLSVEDRAELIHILVKSGLKTMEAGSFVSPQAIPQMADSEKVWELIQSASGDFSFLVANERGLERALAAQVKSIAVFTATSDSFTQKNIGMSLKDSLRSFEKIVSRALVSKLQVRGYVSTAFGCPYEGFQNPEKVVEVADELFQMGCYEVSIGDTIGVAHPRQVLEVFSRLHQKMGLTKLAGHFHDTRGMALLNIKTALELGLHTFDSSVGGLGGCPYAPGSAGNVATEEVVFLLEGLGYSTGVSIEGLFEVDRWMEAKLKKKLHSKLFLSSPKRLYYDIPT